METCVLTLLLMSCVRAVPPAPTPYLPVFRGPHPLEETEGPEFLSVSPVVKVVEGGTGFLQCSLTRLSPHHLVSWLRLPDMSVLTVGGLVFSSDPRLAVTVSPGASIWQLEVRNVSLSDGGEYQCQVNTNTRLSTTVLLSVIERPRANPRGSTVEDTLNKLVKPEDDIMNKLVKPKDDIMNKLDRPDDDALNKLGRADDEQENVATATTVVSKTAPSDKENTSISSPPPTYKSPHVKHDTTGNILLVSMSAFTLVVFSVITAGCTFGLYRKYKYPELGNSRPPSRTGTLDSRRSSGSSGSRRSRRRRGREEDIYSEVRMKGRPRSLCEDDISTHSELEVRPSCEKNGELRLIASPTQQRQQVSLHSFRNSGRRSLDRRQKVSLASSESLSLSLEQEDHLRPQGKKIRFNPYDEFSD